MGAAGDVSFLSGRGGRSGGNGLYGDGGLILISSIIENSYFLAYHDELTTLPARRAFNDALFHLEEPYAVAVVDIDHFKKFNDTYGHETGDQVLRMVAGKLAGVTGGGRAYRVGGEEFSILFPGKTAKDVMPHLELLRSVIEVATFRVRGSEERRSAIRGPRARASDSRAADSRNQDSQSQGPSDQEPRGRSFVITTGETPNAAPGLAGPLRRERSLARSRPRPGTSKSRLRSASASLNPVAGTVRSKM